MPLWTIYHSQDTYTDLEKQELSAQLVKLYPVLPKFYVSIVFHALSSQNFFIGGKPAEKFVRVSVDHIARQFEGDEVLKRKWLRMVTSTLKPFTVDRGLDWELHVDETPFDLWLIQGMRPPLPGSKGESCWIEHNRPVPLPLLDGEQDAFQTRQDP